jgi:mono/diheme cytochrome c family protein
MEITVRNFVANACLGLAVLFITEPKPAEADGYPVQFNFGRQATPQEIAAWDIDVRPDGKGLPKGSGSYDEGKNIYLEKCVNCHGRYLQGVRGTGGKALKGGIGSLASGKPKKTIGSYWPFATTLFDYARRAMPFDNPGSLTDDEVYALSAYILGENGIINNTEIMNAETLHKVMMPNRDGFVSDPRPDVHNSN